MSDERFFNQVKSSLYDYAPAVSTEAYKGMRRKLWWSNFTRLSATRMNMWYLMLLLGIGGGASIYYYNGEAVASRTDAAAPEVLFTPALLNTESSAAVTEESSTGSSLPTCCSAHSSSCCTKSATHPAAAQTATMTTTDAPAGTPTVIAPVSDQPVTANGTTDAGVNNIDTTNDSTNSPTDEVTPPATKKSRGEKKWKVKTWTDNTQKQ